MERFTISKSEKQTLYEIYRACRLCGAGGGYRMPIVQNIIDLESSEVELRQKIQECLQLEVRPDDRMPPLICELCVDKVNDFYQFLELTRQTNVRTRTRLGLPLQTAKKGESEQSDCILGVTEPVFVKDDEPPAKKGKAGPKSKKIKKEPDVEVKVESSSGPSSRSSSLSSRSSRGAAGPGPGPAPQRRPASRPAAQPAPQPAPPRRRRPEPAPAPTPPAATKEKKGIAKELQSLLEDSMKYDDNSLLTPRSLKRKEESSRAVVQPKRTKAAPKEPAKEPTPPPTPPPTRSKPGPKSQKAKTLQTPIAPDPTLAPFKVNKLKAKPQETAVKQVKERAKPPEEPPPPPAPLTCCVCSATFKAAKGCTVHMKYVHSPTFTKPTHACNPCELWFPSPEEAAAHHKHHRETTFPYHCRRCFEDYTTLQLYNEHVEKGVCIQLEETPDVCCDGCGQTFATETLRNAHKCSKPTGKCSHCSKTYATIKNLKKHESQCNQRRKRDLIADPDVLRRLKPMQVRILRCDDLFSREIGDHYDVSTVKPNYGLAKNYVYPYMKFSPVKTEPLYKDSMVAIPVILKGEVDTDRYSHWDSEDSDCETVIRRVPSLTALAIKKLFTKNLLGKVRRKRKRVKNETFENENDFGNISSDINDIINSLGDDMGNSTLARRDLKAKIKDIIGCLDDSDVGDEFDENEETVAGNDDKNSDVGDEVDRNEETVAENEHKNSDGGDEVDRNEKTVAGNENNQQPVDDGNVNSNEETVTVNENDEKVLTDNENDETAQHNLIKSNDIREESNVEQSNGELSDSVIQNNNTNHIDEDNEKLDRLDTGIENNSINNNDDSEMGSLDNGNESNSIVDIGNSEIGRFDNGNEGTSIVDNGNSEIGRLDTESENNSDMNNENAELDIRLQNSAEDENQLDMVNENAKLETSLQKSGEDETQTATENLKELDNIVNGTTNHEKEDYFEDTTLPEKTEEKQLNKESPIKHSIENLIGEDKNPEKYISEVISSLENIIHQSQQNEDVSELANGQTVKEINDSIIDVKEKRYCDNDKITLDDLLPKEDRPSDLENISDDDFNFDA